MAVMKLTPPFTRDDICSLLTSDGEALLRRAQELRHETKGHDVYLRGLIELSSVCERDCLYCGMRRSNPKVRRYVMTDEEIVACAQMARSLNFGTVVLQAGECEALWTRTRVAELIRRICGETGQNVTLSLGERSPQDTEAWREAGAKRYLLRFETSDRDLFAQIHPGSTAPSDEHPRLAQLHRMRAQGYEIGTGIMLGIPGQTMASLAEDFQIIAALAPEMIGLGPYLAHPDTPLGNVSTPSEVPVSVDFTCRCYALARLLVPTANIPSTTALSTLDPVNGRLRGLQSGTNVFMPNLTPAQYREGYEIYPDKICVRAPEADSLDTLHATFAALGLTPIPH